MRKQNIKRNVTLLAFCQALGNTGNIIVFSVSALAASEIAPDGSMATVPLFIQFLAATITTIPASFFMKKFGRRAGFFLGSALASVGGSIAFIAIKSGSFYLFCLGSGFIGILVGFMPYYRFAAVDAADDKFKNNALSLVLAGGVLAALLGPTLADYSVNLLSVEYAGNFFMLMLLPLISITLLLFVKIAPIRISPEEDARSISEVAKNPRFLLALFSGIVGYSAMSILMVSTPLSMKHSALPFENITLVIQWHVLGMFAPSFFTGSLIKRFGVYRIIITGAILNLLCILINTNGEGLYHYWTALFLLGIGWNFMFIGASSLLTECYNESEKAAVQALNEFCILLTVSLSSLFSGILYELLGWKTINLLVLPQICLVLLFSFWLSRQPQPVKI